MLDRPDERNLGRARCRQLCLRDDVREMAEAVRDPAPTRHEKHVIEHGRRRSSFGAVWALEADPQLRRTSDVGEVCRERLRNAAVDAHDKELGAVVEF